MGLNPHTVNRWVAHCMPLVILGALGFASWAFCALICVDYLAVYRRLKGTAVALLVVYAFLLALLLASYIRVVWTINTDPGLVPCGIGGGPTEKEKLEVDSENIVDRNGRVKEKRRADGNHEPAGLRRGDSGSYSGRDRLFTNVSRSLHSRAGDSAGDEIPLESGEILRAVPYTSTSSQSSRMGSRTPSPLPPRATPQLAQPPQAHTNGSLLLVNELQAQNGLIEMPPPVRPHQHASGYSISRPQSLAQWMLPKNLHEFYNMNAFICEGDGLPRWCFHCNCWKPDRSHHCGELARCVRKMDHFCPWVGGVVGETSFKFFYQTVCYGALYCCYILIVTAVVVHDRGTSLRSVPSTWLILLVIASFFLLFCAGMTSSTTQFILRNTTTIDNLSAATKVYQIAIYDPYAPSANSRDSAYTSTTTEHGTPILDRQTSHLAQSNVPIKRITFPDADPALVNMGVVPKRTFVIAKTEPGENPWRLEKRIDNFKEVMGERIFDWFLPIKNSPCATRNVGKDTEAAAGHREGMYKFNPVLMERLRRECGIGMQHTESHQ